MDLMSLLFTVVIWGLILYVGWWGIGKIGLPEPFNKIAIVILVIVTIYVLFTLLSGVSPGGHFVVTR